MRNEVEYKIMVEQPVFAVMKRVEQDADCFYITSEELNRAVFAWFIDRISEGPVPQWLLSDIAKLKQAD